MMTDIKKKLKSKAGASLAAALLVFLVCAMVGSVVLTAAATSLGRSSKADTKANRQRYSLESAEKLINDDLTASAKTTSEESDPDVHLHESWTYRTVAANFVATGKPETETVNNIPYYLYADGKYDQDVPEQISAGDFVLALDQKKATDGYQKENTPDELKDTGAAPENQWSDDWNWKEGAVESANTKYSTYVTVNNGNTSLKSNVNLQSFQNLRNVMAEAIFRHYWYKINNVSEEDLNKLRPGKDGKSIEASSDPWIDNISQTWEDVVKDDDYQISTPKGQPLTINLKEDKSSGDTSMLETVYADVSMDQNFVLTFHLYCGDATGATSAEDKKDSYNSEMYLIYRPDDDKTALSCISTPVISTGSPYSDGRQVYIYQGNDKSIASDEESLRNSYSPYYLKNITWGDTEGDGQSSVSFDYYAPVDVEQTITTVSRSVDLQVKWNAAEVTSIKPETDDSSDGK